MQILEYSKSTSMVWWKYFRAPTCSTPALLSYSCSPLTDTNICLCNVSWASIGWQLRSIINRRDWSWAVRAEPPLTSQQQLSCTSASSSCFRCGGKLNMTERCLTFTTSVWGYKTCWTHSDVYVVQEERRVPTMPLLRVTEQRRLVAEAACCRLLILLLHHWWNILLFINY